MRVREGGANTGRVVIAVVVTLTVVSGGATAASHLITGAQVKNGSLTGVDIKNGSIRGIDIRNGAVQSRHVRNGSLVAGDFAPGTIVGPQTVYTRAQSDGRYTRGGGRITSATREAAEGSTQPMVAIPSLGQINLICGGQNQADRIQLINQSGASADIFNPDNVYENVGQGGAVNAHVRGAGATWTTLFQETGSPALAERTSATLVASVARVNLTTCRGAVQVTMNTAGGTIVSLP